MARNEEKQLARLNRFYLQQQQDEELKKRPPRPKLENLTTADDVKKWIPSIIKDIEFYVKQLEVPCYRNQQIKEFNKCLNNLRGEYRAFLHKVRQLDQSLDANPWTDRPYSRKRKKTPLGNSGNSTDTPKAAGTNVEASCNTDLSISFTPIATPVLHEDSSFKNFYGYGKSVEVQNDTDDQSQNQPLQLSLVPASKLPMKQEAPSSFVDGEYKTSNSALPSRGDDKPKEAIDNRLNSQAERAEQELSTEPQSLGICQCQAGSCLKRQCICVKSLQHLNKAAGNSTLNLPYTDSSSSDES